MKTTIIPAGHTVANFHRAALSPVKTSAAINARPTSKRTKPLASNKKDTPTSKTSNIKTTIMSAGSAAVASCHRPALSPIKTSIASNARPTSNREKTPTPNKKKTPTPNISNISTTIIPDGDTAENCHGPDLSPMKTSVASNARPPSSGKTTPTSTRKKTSTSDKYSPVGSSNLSNLSPASSRNRSFVEDSEFDLMRIEVTVFGLAGILVDKKEKASSKGKMDSNQSLSDTSSAESADNGVGTLGNTPVYAVVTHHRNVSSSAFTIASHLPSIPLADSTRTIGSSHRYDAGWSAQNFTYVEDEEAQCSLMDQSTFTMNRVMMREPYGHFATFVHETVQLELNLKRGDEMIPLGVASFVISGDEEGALIMNVPAKAIRLKGKKVVVAENVLSKKKKKKKGRFFKKSVLKPSFPSAKSVEYTLDENATLKIALRVIAESSFKEIEAAKARHAHQEQRRRDRQEYRQNEVRKHYAERLAAGLKDVDLHLKSRAAADCNEITGKPFGMAQFLCSSMMCMDGTKKEGPPESLTTDVQSPSNGTQDDFSMDNSAMQSYLRNHGVHDNSSILSSVSESESESESEDEARENLVDKSIVIRPRTFEK